MTIAEPSWFASPPKKGKLLDFTLFGERKQSDCMTGNGNSMGSLRPA